MRPTPMPASATMSAERAAWYEQHTHGQLRPVPTANPGTCYLYDTTPAPSPANRTAGATTAPRRP